jgi:translation initiation factor 1
MTDKIVYSTDPAWQPSSDKASAEKPAKPKQAEPVRLSFRRGHKGSGMTLIERLQMHPAGKEELLKKFKKKLGVGGTVKLGALEIQGDHRDFVETELKALGYKVKRLG